jgi:hypothetical protein
MDSLQLEYQDLLDLTKQYLLQEHGPNYAEDTKNKKWVVSELDTYNYFKNYALQSKNVLKASQISQRQEEVNLRPSIPSSIPKSDVLIRPVEVIKQPFVLKEEIAKPQVHLSAATTPSLPKTEMEKNNRFELEPLKPATRADLNDIRKTVQEIFPRQIILDQIPNYEPQIVIISDCREKHIQAFLTNFSKAIDLNIAPSRIMSSAKFSKTTLPELKLVIQATDNQSVVKNFPKVLNVPDVSKYFREPQLKAELWEMTKQSMK